MIRRTGRIFLNVLTVASFLLCLAAAGAWVRSYWTADYLICFDRIGTRDRERRLLSRYGAIAWAEHEPTHSFREGLPEGAGAWRHLSVATEGSSVGRETPAFAFVWEPTFWQKAGFIYHRGYQENMNATFIPTFVIGLPYWAFCLLLMSLPTIQFVRCAASARSQRRRAAGRCRQCGYDLRATPDRCPECGIIPTR